MVLSAPSDALPALSEALPSPHRDPSSFFYVKAFPAPSEAISAASAEALSSEGLSKTLMNKHPLWGRRPNTNKLT